MSLCVASKAKGPIVTDGFSRFDFILKIFVFFHKIWSQNVIFFLEMLASNSKYKRIHDYDLFSLFVETAVT